MSRWWRAYDDALNDPKVQRLPGELFKTWFNLLCVASKHDGVLPDNETLAFMLRSDLAKLKIDLDQLTACGLIDRAGDRLQPHNWQGRQHKSDVSNERVARYRERQRNVTDTVTVTPPEQNRTDSERTDARALDLRKKVMAIYEAARHTQFPDAALCDVWLARGMDERIVETTIAERVVKGKPFKPLAYFEPILWERHKIKIERPKVDPALEERAWAIKCERGKREGRPEATWGPPSDFIAKWKATNAPASI